MQAVGPSLPWNSKDTSTSKFGGAMHAVLVSELQLFSGEERRGRGSHLQRIIATYMAFARLSMSTGAPIGTQ
jgi:hypothetical protein